MIPEYEERIAFRTSTKQKQQIEKLIKEGHFKNFSQVIRAALKEFLKEGGCV